MDVRSLALGVRSSFLRLLQQPFPFEFGIAAAGGIPENEHGSQGLSVPVSNRRGAVLDGKERACTRGKKRALGGMDTLPMIDDLESRVLDRLGRLFIDQRKDARYRLSGYFLSFPTRQILSHPIKERNAPTIVADHNSIMNAEEGCLQKITNLGGLLTLSFEILDQLFTAAR